MNTNTRKNATRNRAPAKKFVLTGETKQFYGTTLHRIKAVKTFGNVKAGTVGGFVEREENLSQKGTCFIFDNGKAYDQAQVRGDVIVKDRARVFGRVVVDGGIKLTGRAALGGDIAIIGKAQATEPSGVAA
jgi:hypothetical protein